MEFFFLKGDSAARGLERTYKVILPSVSADNMSIYTGGERKSGRDHFLRMNTIVPFFTMTFLISFPARCLAPFSVARIS